MHPGQSRRLRLERAERDHNWPVLINMKAVADEYAGRRHRREVDQAIARVHEREKGSM